MLNPSPFSSCSAKRSAAAQSCKYEFKTDSAGIKGAGRVCSREVLWNSDQARDLGVITEQAPKLWARCGGSVGESEQDSPTQGGTEMRFLRAALSQKASNGHHASRRA